MADAPGPPIGIIEAGWRSLEAAVLPRSTTSPVQRAECRKFFYGGAAHLLAAIMTGLDPGADPTDADLARMDAIEAEISAFFDDIVKDLPLRRRR